MNKEKLIEAVKASLKKSEESFQKQEIKWKGMSESEKSEIKNALMLALKQNKAGNKVLVKKMLAFLGTKMEEPEEESKEEK
jgi:hypothetical protein